MGFIDLEKAYDRVNREALWQVLRMYDVGGKLLSGIKSMYVDSVTCVRVKEGETKCFRTESCVRKGCRVPLAFQCVPLAFSVMKEVRVGEEGREGRFPGLLNVQGFYIKDCTYLFCCMVVRH